MFLLKKLLCTAILALGVIMLMTVGAYAQMPKDKIALQGEDSFKAEMFNEFSDTIEDNALYVATTGIDSNTGTIDKPFATVQKALDTVKAGQTIYVRGGTYNALNTFKTSGSEGKYITLRNYPNETPFLTVRLVQTVLFCT